MDEIVKQALAKWPNVPHCTGWLLLGVIGSDAEAGPTEIAIIADHTADPAFLLHALARFWLAGGEVDWEGYWAGERRRRLSLPSYPFERRRYWVDPLAAAARPAQPAARREDPAEWFYVPVWKQSRQPCLPAPPTPAEPAPAPAAGIEATAAETAAPETWLILLDRCGLGEALAELLEAGGRRVVRVAAGETWSHGPSGFTVAPGRREDYEALLAALGRNPPYVLHLWNVTEGMADMAGASEVDAALDRGFYSLVFLAQALGQRSAAEPAAITVVSNGLCDVTGEEPLERAIRLLWKNQLQRDVFIALAAVGARHAATLQPEHAPGVRPFRHARRHGSARGGDLDLASQHCLFQ